MRLVVPVLILFVGGGCQTLAPEEGGRRARDRAAAVTVVDPEAAEAAVAGCEKVGDLSVRPPFPLLAQRYPELSSFGQAEVEAELRYRAALAGGDTVVPTGLADGRTQADAYDCGGADGRRPRGGVSHRRERPHSARGAGRAGGGTSGRHVVLRRASTLKLSGLSPRLDWTTHDHAVSSPSPLPPPAGKIWHRRASRPKRR